MDVEEGIITKVEVGKTHYFININSIGFGLSKRYKVKPNVGDKITLCTKNFSTIRGVFINGKKVFYKSDKQLEQDHKRFVNKLKRQREQQFKKEEKQLDERYNKLPDVFKQRIDNFRKNNINFRIEYESYELFCCEQAIIIANKLKTVENVEKLKNSDDYYLMVPELDHGHSGNTMGMSIFLAYWFLKEQQKIIEITGALAPLVGSKEFEEKNKRYKFNGSSR